MCNCKYCSYDNTDEIKNLLESKLNLGALGEFEYTVYESKLTRDPSMDLTIENYNRNGNLVLFDSFKINFCPMCGRQLRKELIED
jgi:hypothetical protein